MKRFYPVWLFLFVTALPAQQSTLRVYLNAIEIRFETRLEPPANGADRFPGGVVVDRDELQSPGHRRVHRSITDATHRRSFGYDLILESMPDPQTVRLRFEPLSVVTANPGETLLAPPKFPVIPVVHVGETVALDLLINPATGQKVVDYLSVRRASPGQAAASETPHDFALADLQLNLSHPRIWVNGKPLDAGVQDAGGSISAHVFWLGLPAFGSFEISLWPEPGLGFQKAGTLNGNTLTFRAGSSEYRVESDVPIAPGSGLYNIYVLHDSTWKGGFIVAGSEKAGMIHIE